MDWSGMDYFWFCDVFISRLDSHSDGTHPLRGSFGEQVMQCLIPPNLFWWRNKPIYILNDLRVSNIKQIVSLENYSFNKLKTYKQLKSAETNLPHLNHDIWSFWAAEIWLSVANDLHLQWNSCELSEMMNLAINYSDIDIY